MKYIIEQIREDFLHNVRVNGKDDLNQNVITVFAKGGEPCRDVLRCAQIGEELILASYCAFEEESPYKEYGPIFVLKNPSSEKVNYSKLPLSMEEGFDYLPKSFVLKAYNKKEHIIAAEVTTEKKSSLLLTDYLKNKQTCFVVARYAAYGCFALKIKVA
jgi:hypothetical protein